jgi:hypothetical protein
MCHAELGHYTMQNNPDNYNFVNTHHDTLTYKINPFYIA